MDARMYPTNILSTTSGINTEARILMGILINILAWEKIATRDNEYINSERDCF